MAQRNDHKRRQPSKYVKTMVRKAFDADTLIDICSRQDFSAYAERTTLEPDRWSDDRFYWHKDNGSSVLAVAHLDHVQKESFCNVTETAAGLLATSGALDDRLGVYVILDMLPKLGCNVDVLLTTDEECAASTASDFRPEKDYNWMIEFDRGGTDVVMYQYERPEYAELVENAGAQMGVGSYSDIASLDHLGCAGFNWGVGYADYHSAKSHAWLNDTFRMVARFVQFYASNSSLHLPHVSSWSPMFDDDEEWIEADCGHDVNLADGSTYGEMFNGTCIVCLPCWKDYIHGGNDPFADPHNRKD